MTVNSTAASRKLMSRAILDQTAVPTPLADAVANMRVIEAIKASAAQGQWVSLE